jgi:hypothetical protein
MENKYFQEKATKDIITETISWVWFDMKQNLKGLTKVDGTFGGFDKGILTLDFLLKHQLLKKTCQMFMMV